MSLKEELIAMSIAAGLSAPAAAQPVTPSHVNDSIPQTTITVSPAQNLPAEDEGTLIVDTEDSLARAHDKIAQKNALNSRVANPWKTSIHYKTKEESIIGDQFIYEIKTKLGSIELHTRNPDPRDNTRGCSASLSDDFNDLVASLVQEPVEIKTGKYQGRFGYPSSKQIYPSKETAKKAMESSISGSIAEYFRYEALRVYVEQNKADFTSDTYFKADHFAELKQKELEKLKKIGVVLDAKGNFKTAPIPLAETMRMTATRRPVQQAQK